MKIAIFHNFLDNIGGAEIVGLTLARELNADIYTTNIDKDKIVKMGFEDVLPRIYSIGKVPINAPLKQQFSLWKFRKLNLKDKYDFYIIDGDWAMSGVVNNKPNIWYVHSPIREIWDLYKYTRQNTVPWFARWVFDVWVVYNRFLNKKYVKSANAIVCNSDNTKNRLKKFLKRDGVVIPPPIETSKFKFESSGNYWLAVNRLITHKRIDLQLKAFSKLPTEKLIIVGCYEQSRHFKQYAEYCKKIKPDNVEIKSWVNQEELAKLYANCKGFITTSQDEDFGMNVVEAMASGKPVVAPNEGGYKETILNDKTGILIDNIDENKIIEAIKKIGNNPLEFKEACLQQAKNFDTNMFIQKIKKEIEKCRCGKTEKELQIKTIENGIKFCAFSESDFWPVYEVWREKIYSRKDYNIKKNFTVIDIGAHIGSFSVYAGRVAKQVFSYEPIPDTFDLLTKNIQINGLTNVFANNLAVLEKKYDDKIIFIDDVSCNTSFYKKTANPIKVKAVSLEDIFKDNKIERCDLLKIDAEGSEREILKNTPKEYFDRIDRMIVEYHDFLSRNEMLKLVKILTDRNYKIEELKLLGPKYGIIFAKKENHNIRKENYVYIAKKYPLYILNKTIIAVFKDVDHFIGQVGIFLRKTKRKKEFKIVFEGIDEIKKSIETNRDSKNILWRGLIFLKDAFWVVKESFLKVVYIPTGLKDAFSYLFIEPPIISPRSYIPIADSNSFPEFKGGVFNPGAINSGKDVFLLMRGEKHVRKILNEKEEYFKDTCSPIFMVFGEKKYQIFKINYPKKDGQRMEDFRLFKFQNKIYSNFSILNWDPSTFFIKRDFTLLEGKMLIGELDVNKKELNNIGSIKTDFDLERWEKNWVLFQKDNDLYLIYSFFPYYRLLKLNSFNQNQWDFKTVTLLNNDLPFKNVYGKIMGLSINPIEYDENYLLLVAHLKNRKSYSYKFWGVLIDKKTLLPKKITSRPLFRSCGLILRFPPQVTYVSSIVKKDDNFICFLGKGDKKTLYTSIEKKALDKYWIDIEN